MSVSNPYLVFYGERFYPTGGWKDFSASFTTLEEAIAYIKTLDSCFCWAHVMHNGKVIFEAEGDFNRNDVRYEWSYVEVTDEDK